MNQIKQISLIILLSMAFFRCQDKITKEITYMANVPVYMSNEEFKTAIKKTGQQELNNPGKIYIKDKYLFVNEINKGIHVYNNSDPSAPAYVCFINIPGNVDMAIKGDLLYVDSYIDLVVIDIADPSSPEEVDRYPNAFPNIYPEYDYNYPIALLDPEKGIVVDWKIEEITIERVEDRYYGGKGLMESSAFSGMDMSGGRGNIGIAGSMARFAIKGNALYAINNGNELKTFDIGTHQIKKVDSIRIFRNIETLFIYEDKLFIGSNNGMFIYDVHDSKHPVYISQYDHVTSCDPVVVSGDYAFVTLRSGTNCNTMINELNVISLVDIQNPTLVKAYNMYNPYGLGIDNNLLFICDGSAGLKVYDATDIYTIDQNLIKHFQDIRTFDVIPYNDILIMTGSDGIYQYDYSDIQNITELSHITINQPND